MKLRPLPDRPLRLLHLGDSYTIGEGVAPDQSWPGQFRKLVESGGQKVRKSKIIAQTGWTTKNLLEAVSAISVDSKWDMVTICIGVNNQYQGRSLLEFKNQLRQLLAIGEILLAPDGAQLILLSIPDWSITPFAETHDRCAIANEIDAFNAAIQRLAESEDIPYLEWTSISRQFADTAAAFAEDGLHPSGQQYKAWACHLANQFVPPDQNV